MKIQVKRFDKSIPLPEYKTAGSVAMDLYIREDLTIKANEIGYAPANIAVKVPEGKWVLVAPRSSLHKHGLMLANSIAIGDADFCGDNDEYKLILYNFTKKDVFIEKGMRLAQMMVMDVNRVEIEEVEKLDDKDRGGIGSTGVY